MIHNKKWETTFLCTSSLSENTMRHRLKQVWSQKHVVIIMVWLLLATLMSVAPSVSAFTSFGFSSGRQAIPQKPFFSIVPAISRRPSHVYARSGVGIDEGKTHGNQLLSFEDDLIRSLDLIPLMEDVARYTTTRRGYNNLLSLVKKEQSSKTIDPFGSSMGISRRDRIMNEMMTSPTTTSKERIESDPICTIAQSLHEVQREYKLVEEATSLLQAVNSTNEKGNPQKLSYPPIYGIESTPYEMDLPTTDDDEWLTIPPNQFTAEDILKAEQIIKLLVQVKQWSEQQEIQSWTPNLQLIASKIETNELQELYNEIVGSVEIRRVKSITDIQGKSSYSVKLKDDRFPVLQILREKETALLKRGAKEYDKDIVSVQSEIETTTSQIISGLAQSVLGSSNVIDHGLDIVARLDVIMAKAAFADSLNGILPIVQTDGEISVENFVHPLLARSMEQDDIVPVDLQLSSGSTERALVISGPNGGGKTLTMKSFGIVSIFTKLGIPIPMRPGSKRPKVDFFDNILVNIGDRQNIIDGESTWTSILNSCASMIDTIDRSKEEGKNDSYLVLLDEFGSAGTDPEACGAVAQAILEELMTKPCKVVATTHSPRLKAFSFNDDRVGCASVLLDDTESKEYQTPSFKLEYGIIGESYALGAASRTNPPLPDSVISRASELMSTDEKETEEMRTHKTYVRALTDSMTQQLERIKMAATMEEDRANDLERCRSAMISLAGSYESHLDRMLEKLDDTFQRFRNEGGSDLELIGRTVSEIKAAKRKIATQQERLANQGLKVLPIDYELTPGESVVIIADGELEGMTARVASESSTKEATLRQNEVLVIPSPSLHAWDTASFAKSNPMTDRPMIFQRHDLAIWEYDSIYDDSFQPKAATSISDSKQKITSLLATLNSVSTKSSSSNKRADAKSSRGKSFRSSRERKAASKGKNKRR